MTNLDLHGIFTIIPTPLTAEGEVDETGLAHLIHYCRKSGLHAAVILGSNSEFPYFSFPEKVRIIRTAAEAAEGLPVVTGVSAYGTEEALSLTRSAREAGCAAVLAALPLYYQLDFTALLAHYRALAEEGGLPVLFYYWPEVTGVTLSPDEIAQLAEIEGVRGAKLTVLNRPFIKRVIQLTRTRLWAVFAGSSFLLASTLKEGGAGVLCPLPLLAPRECLEIYHAMEKGEVEKAEELQDRILGALPLFSGVEMDAPVASALFKVMAGKPYTGPGTRPPSTVALIKEALRLQGHPITAVVRRPQPVLTPQQSELVAKVLKKQGWL